VIFFGIVLRLILITAQPAAAETRARLLMGTLCTVTAEGPRAQEAITAAFEEIARLERVMSGFIPDSELSSFIRGAGAPFPASEDLRRVLRLSVDVCRASGGAFDVTYASPKESRGCESVGFLPDGRVRLRPGATVDLGGIGKGYALDAAAAALRSHGVTSALFNFGGQLLALGAWPAEALRPSAGAAALSFGLRDASASTSGDGERPGHIRDPRTGLPVRRAVNVTVVARTATSADAWDTPLYIAGLSALPAGVPVCALELPERGPVRYAGDCSPYPDLLRQAVPAVRRRSKERKTP